MKGINQSNQNRFIHNPDFVKWVIRPSEESDQFWDAYMAENQSQQIEIKQARLIIKGLTRSQKPLSDADVTLLWDRINQADNLRTRKIINLKRWAAAASILLLLGISGWWLATVNKQNLNKINYQSIAVNAAPDNEIKLILSDQTQKSFTENEVELKYDQDGKLVIKNGKQVQTASAVEKSELEQVNQLVVPRGKRSSIILADGTKLWLNSGSRVIYPVVFNKKSREIYIEGEGYLEVAHDAAKPFYVVTDQVKVKVLGTKFDISAYKEDNHVSVTLVEGSVQASIGGKDLMMKPNQLLNYSKLTQKSTIEKTNVLEQVSWIDGLILCNKQQIRSVIAIISRYYDITINYDIVKLDNITLTGKLDLKSDYEEVLKVICTTAPLKYEIIDNKIFLNIK